jgi:thymidine kinase
MFIEPNLSGQQRGYIEVVCGSMFSGKTEELIRRLRRARIAQLRTEIFKPAIDVRYHETQVVSHDATAVGSTPIKNSQEILFYASDVQVVGIDEAQFFDEEVVNVAQTLATQGVRVIIAGLDMDFLGRPFGPMPQLMAIADNVTKLHAICMCCGGMANISYRKNRSDQATVLLGETETYEPRCRSCHALGEKAQRTLK